MSRVLPILVLVLAGCGDPIVGGACRPGYQESGGRCVEIVSPFVDDGGTRARPDAGQRLADDASTDDATATPTPDSGIVASGCDIGLVGCGDECVRVERDLRHCGSCGNECPDGDVCAAGECVSLCRAPFEICDGVCVDLSTTDDPDNCGACGRRCDSGICVAGSCRDATAGHVIVTGHDYRTSRPGIRRVAGNAVFLATGPEIDVLTYEGVADPMTIRGIDRAIDQVARERGRGWTKATAAEKSIPRRLANADVFLVYPQGDMSDRSLWSLGGELSIALGSFLRRGGVVVVFDGVGSNAGTWQLLEAAGLFGASGVEEVTGDSLSVSAPADAVALGVPLSYAAESTSVRFLDATGTTVVAHSDGPVVLHDVVLP